jgi:autophagy-related protein 9
MVHQMNQELCRLGSVFYYAAMEAWANRNARQRRQPVAHRHHAFDRLPQQEQRPEQVHGNDAYMQQFGIPLGKEEDYTAASDGGDDENINRKGFVFLPKFQRRPDPHGGHAFVANLDVYLQNLYSYFYHRGLTPIICKGVVELVTLIMTLLLSVFLFAYVDWPALAQCHDEATCRADFRNYIIRHPLRQLGLWHGTVIGYIILFCAYTVLRLLAFVETIESAVAAQLVYENHLGISNQKLLGGAVDWNVDVVGTLMDDADYRISVTPLDALVITNRIMRKENYLIAMFNRGVLDLRMPSIFGVITDTCYCPSIEVRRFVKNKRPNTRNV